MFLWPELLILRWNFLECCCQIDIKGFNGCWRDTDAEVNILSFECSSLLNSKVPPGHLLGLLFFVFLHVVLSSRCWLHSELFFLCGCLRVDREENRYPENITIAECLFEGCFINQQEDFSYNSVPVYSAEWVLKKTWCHSWPNKYVFKVISIKVQVACTCAVPTYYEGANTPNLFAQQLTL